MGNVQNCEIGLLLSRMKKADNKTEYALNEKARLKEEAINFKGSNLQRKRRRISQLKRGFGNTW